jgi:predicted component of type VI protein secretion system
MVQLKIVSGKQAGFTYVARRFPVRIGRAKAADLEVDEDGVWDQHLQLDFHATDGFCIAALSGGLVRVNGQPIERTVLRNGDEIELGALKLRFWLSESRQAGLRVREYLTWAVIASLTLGQVGLIYWLLR